MQDFGEEPLFDLDRRIKESAQSNGKASWKAARGRDHLSKFAFLESKIERARSLRNALAGVLAFDLLFIFGQFASGDPILRVLLFLTAAGAGCAYWARFYDWSEAYFRSVRASSIREVAADDEARENVIAQANAMTHVAQTLAVARPVEGQSSDNLKEIRALQRRLEKHLVNAAYSEQTGNLRDAGYERARAAAVESELRRLGA